MVKVLHHNLEDPTCRLCGCTEGARCSPEGCCMVHDPFGGALCAACMDQVGHALAETLAGLARAVGGPGSLAAINGRVNLLVRFAELDEPTPAPDLALVAIPVPA